VRDTGLGVIHERMPPGAAEPRHHHERARQFFFVLAGILTIEMDGVVHTMAAGQGLEVPPGARHQSINRSPGPVEFLVVSAPTTRGDRIEA
jgi:mannose-6-phosphate isomerase-like protein (cupin superfamily)